MNGACHQGDGFDMDKDFLAMLLTVLLAVLAKVRAAGVAAGASWFSRHACRLLSDNRKAPKGLLL